MPVNVRYKGGPMNGKKATLRDTDKAPVEIKAVAQARAKNMKPGVYMLAHQGEYGDADYVWSYYG